MMSLVYVAGPYTGTPEEIAENVRRAGILARFALFQGYAPIAVHAAIAAGHLGRDEVPAEREAGISAMVEICRHLGAHEGHLWAIARDDSSLSAGVEREVDAFSGACRRDPMERLAVGPWDWWRRMMFIAGFPFDG